jgi:hypothetical protein
MLYNFGTKNFTFTRYRYLLLKFQYYEKTSPGYTICFGLCMR